VDGKELGGVSTNCNKGESLRAKERAFPAASITWKRENRGVPDERGGKSHFSVY